MGGSTHPTPTPPVVVVKVGSDGKYMPFETPDLLHKHTTTFLKALKADEVFAEGLKGVRLDACTVSIVKGELPASKDEPDVADEADANLLELKGAKTLGEAAAIARTGSRLFVRVALPAAATGVPAGLSARPLACVWLCPLRLSLTCSPRLHMRSFGGNSFTSSAW